jgi:hypothetical protein
MSILQTHNCNNLIKTPSLYSSTALRPSLVESQKLGLMVDSGASLHFISFRDAQKLQNVRPVASGLVVKLSDGSTITSNATAEPFLCQRV